MYKSRTQVALKLGWLTPVKGTLATDPCEYYFKIQLHKAILTLIFRYHGVVFPVKWNLPRYKSNNHELHGLCNPQSQQMKI